MKWVTRERPKIDRIACPWLIARFIDAEPSFLYVPAQEVLPVAEEAGAVPYDVPGVELGHEGEYCSFDAFIRKYRLGDPALMQLARIVRGADTSRLDLTPQSPGLYAFSLGLSRTFQDDLEQLRHGMVMYDALYAWCREDQVETHHRSSQMTVIKLVASGLKWQMSANGSVYARWGAIRIEHAAQLDQAALFRMLGNMVVERFHEIAIANGSSAVWYPLLGEVYAEADERDFPYAAWLQQALEEIELEYERWQSEWSPKG